MTVLPLVNKDTYNVLRVIPVPITVGEGKFVYIDAGTDILFGQVPTFRH